MPGTPATPPWVPLKQPRTDDRTRREGRNFAWLKQVQTAFAGQDIAGRNTQVMANQVVDTIVVGAGPAGCVVARNLAAAGQRVVLVARAAHPEDEWVRPDTLHFHRTDTVLPEAGEHLDALGLLDRFRDCAPLVCPGIVCMRDEQQPPRRQLTSFPSGFAWHVERQRLDNWLMLAAYRAGVRTIHGACNLGAAAG